MKKYFNKKGHFEKAFGENERMVAKKWYVIYHMKMIK